ncbi:rhodanese [Tamlana nanhaiensis]|uniref:Rhodanese n=1 Tax=Neotamlana nanhaiensis TaxID=1382798 RepID=A0A0D7VYN8_9FLAO|nr:rhodanese-like domain-containing protein [Tamlana nanhaiensis]KJD31558.1 rhodanese [Tamlana nanhaiensis]
MKKKFLYITLLFSGILFSQETLSELLKNHNNKSVPYISVHELAMPKTKATLLDAREKIEFETSHIQDAIHVGYDNFSIQEISEKLKNKQQTIVVYCSLGIRSNNIAKQLKKAGYTNVFNLFGGIFEWKNNNFTVYNQNNEPTENVHVFSRSWSKWLKKGNKIYD